MIAALVAAFLIVHGLLHPGVWTAPVQPGKPAPFDPGHSWALEAAQVSAAPARAAALALAWYTALVYVVAGAGTFTGSDWWTTAAVVAASCGLALKAIWFHPWLTVGALLDVGVIVAVACAWPTTHRPGHAGLQAQGRLAGVDLVRRRGTARHTAAYCR